MVDELFRIRAANEDLAHMGNIEHSCTVAHSIVFVCDACILNRHNEAAERAHQRPKGHVLVIKTGFRKILFHIIGY